MLTNAAKETEINEKIENARKLFYNAVLAQKRCIRRNLLEMHSIANRHSLETMSYRATLKKAMNEDFQDIPNSESPSSLESLPHKRNSTATADSLYDDDLLSSDNSDDWVSYSDNTEEPSKPDSYLDRAELYQEDSSKYLYYYSFPPHETNDQDDDGDITKDFVDCDNPPINRNY